MLADPRQAGRSVTDIAFTVGFKDSSHFSRAFKDRYGVGPRGYRGNRDPRPRGTAESG
jgi:AraC-like DNA-binding protein